MVQPVKWGEVLGYNANCNELPENATLTASFSKLFPEITQIPLEVGGTPPKRMDLNAIFKLIGENVFYYQNGGVFEYNDNFHYEVGNVIRFNNKIFLCIRENSRTNKHAPNDTGYWSQITTNDILRNYVKSVNGITPDVNGNVSFSYVKYTDLTPYAKRTELEPKANRTELAPLATKAEVEIACPVGTIHAFAGVSAPNGWLLCNGQAVSRSQFSRLFSVISTRYGGGDGWSTFNIPKLNDGSFVRGVAPSAVGTSYSASLPPLTVSSNGAHTHTRGTMEITGRANTPAENYVGTTDGAFYKILNNATIGDHNYTVQGLGFQASRSWTGATSLNGAHTHTISNSAGVAMNGTTVLPQSVGVNYIIKY